MSLITKNTHALINYLIGFILTFSPWLFSFDAGGIATCIPWLSGLTIIFYTLLSDNGFGTQGGISIKMTCILDAAVGLIIGSSPWLFGFADYASASHLFSGLSLSLNAFIAAPLGLQKLLFKMNSMQQQAVENNKRAIVNAANMVLSAKQNKAF
jgi:hypothetical protein